MLEGELRDLRREVALLDREMEAIERRLAGLSLSLATARAEIVAAFAALPRTAGNDLVGTMCGGDGEQVRLQRRYMRAERAWNELAREDRHLRSQLTSLRARHHEAVVEHRNLFQRIWRKPTSGEQKVDGHGAPVSLRIA
jgi:hypothetical protein